VIVPFMLTDTMLTDTMLTDTMLVSRQVFDSQREHNAEEQREGEFASIVIVKVNFRQQIRKRNADKETG